MQRALFRNHSFVRKLIVIQQFFPLRVYLVDLQHFARTAIKRSNIKAFKQKWISPDKSVTQGTSASSWPASTSSWISPRFLCCSLDLIVIRKRGASLTLVTLFCSAFEMASVTGKDVSKEAEGKMKGEIVVYSILGCPHCMHTKKLLGDLGLAYTDIRLDLYPHIKKEVMDKSGKATVPQIYFNEVFVGGNSEFQKLVEDKDKFDALLKKVKENPVPKDGPIIPDPSTAVAEPDPFSMKCEPDEYFLLVDEMKKNNIVSTNRVFLKCHKNSFVGKDFVKWVVEEKGVDESKAKAMGQSLIDRHFVRSQSNGDTFAGGSELYVLNEDDDSKALNGGSLSECVPKEASEIGELLRKMILKLYSVFLTPDGKAVDYKGMKKSDEFSAYIKMTKELQRVDIEKATREEKLAFFINIYNALVIHANIERGPPTSLWGRYKFFNNTKYIIGGFPYSLQDIENGVLRANRKGVGQLSNPFDKDDPRLKVALDRHEPLIHFALVCGAKSCPPIKTYTPNNVYEELQVAAAAFLENDDGCMIDENNNTVKLSAIFKWYQEDFGKNKKELLEFIKLHMNEGSKLKSLKRIMESGKYKVSFLKYDWSVNAKS